MESNQSRAREIFGWVLSIWGIMALLGTGVNCLTIFAYHAHTKLSSLPLEFLYCVVLISGGVGLIKQKSWARILALFVIVPLFIIIMPYRQFTFLAHFKGHMNPKLSLIPLIEITRIVLGFLLVYFLTRSKVKEQFR